MSNVKKEIPLINDGQHMSDVRQLTLNPLVRAMNSFTSFDYIRSVNGIAPDVNGNVKLKIESITNTSRYDASAIIKNKLKSSSEMNVLIKTVQENGGGTIVLGDDTYVIDGIITDSGDEFNTGWLVPYTESQGQVDTNGVTFELSSGTLLSSTEDNLVMIRGSNNFTRITGTGKFKAAEKNVIHVGFIPENMKQTTTRVSQQFCGVDKDISFSGGYSAVTFQPGPTINGAASGSFFHRVGFSYCNVSYPVWFKPPPDGTKDVLTTTTYLEHIYGHFSVSSGKFEACDVHMTNCAFEGMSGEAVEYVELGSNGSTLTNKLIIDNCDFEAYATSKSFSLWGIILGTNNKFVSAADTSVEIKSTLSPNVQYGKQVYGTYDAVTVAEHVVEHVSGPSGDTQKKMAFIINNDGFNVVSVNTPYIFSPSEVWFNCPVKTKKGLTEYNGPSDLYSGLRTTLGDNWNGLHVRCNSEESKKTNQVGVRVEFNGARKGFHPYQYVRDGVETFMITDGGDLYCAKGAFKSSDICGIRISGEKDYSAFVHVPLDNTNLGWSTSLRCYGGTDWRIGEEKIVTDAPSDGNEYTRVDGAWKIATDMSTSNASRWSGHDVAWITVDPTATAAYSKQVATALNVTCNALAIPNSQTTQDILKSDYLSAGVYILDTLAIASQTTVNTGHDLEIIDDATYGGMVRDIFVTLSTLKDTVGEKAQFVLLTSPNNDNAAIKARNEYTRQMGEYFGCTVVSLDHTCGLWNANLVSKWNASEEVVRTISDNVLVCFDTLYPAVKPVVKPTPAQ